MSEVKKLLPSDKTTYQQVAQRGSVDYMLRTVQQNQVQLNLMADQKANILIGAAMIVLTVILGQIHSSTIYYGLITLAGFIFLAAIFALLAVKPSYKKIDSQSSHFNPLFFGHFSKFGEAEYIEYLEPILESDARIYQAIARDIYQAGHTLHFKKYRYLRYSYMTLLVGLCVALPVTIVELIQHT